jgi:CPA1 family monovalent cation:H+ antiporter
MSYIELSGRAPAATRVQRTAVWDMARFTLNGLMFVLLGEQLPDIVSRAMMTAGETGGFGAGAWLVICALVITIVLAGLRYAWIWVSLRLMLFRARRAGNEIDDDEVDPRIVPVMSLAGVRGAITLAAVMSLPLVMKQDELQLPFPARDQAIFIAAMVILISLVAASVLLPRLLRGRAMSVPDASAEESKEENAIREAAVAAIKAVEEASHKMAENENDETGFCTQAALRVIETYRDRLADEPYVTDDGQSLCNADRVELELRQIALKAERDTIAHLARTRHISDDVFRRLMDRVDFLSVAHHPKTSHHQ